MNWKQMVPMLIPLIVPILIGLLKQIWAKVPSRLLPILAPILGALADLLSGWAGLGSFGPQWGAAMGLAGVGLREVYDQNRPSKPE